MKNDTLEKYVQLRRQLTDERLSLQSRLNQIDEALGVIGTVSTPAVENAAPAALPPAKGARGGKRTMSPEARARIAAAQKARWAKQRGEKPAPATSTATNGAMSEKPKRKMSAAGRKAIADGAKRRWAKAKAAGKSKL